MLLLDLLLARPFLVCCSRADFHSCRFLRRFQRFRGIFQIVILVALMILWGAGGVQPGPMALSSFGIWIDSVPSPSQVDGFGRELQRA